MWSDEIESRSWKRSVEPDLALARRSKRVVDESLVRIERYARILAPKRRATRTVATSNVLAAAPSARAVALDPGVGGSASPCGFFDPSTRCPGDVQEGKMMRLLSELGNFARGLSVLARFGDLSRARLSLLRVQLCGEYAECDWIARRADPWDAGLPPIVGKRNASTQALHDAIRVRALLFRVLPDLHKAELRAYRYSPGESLELIVSGTVSREVRAPAGVRSLAMRAKLFGLNFCLDEGVLEDLQPEECAVSS
jgi:hypothetical protein